MTTHPPQTNPHGGEWLSYEWRGHRVAYVMRGAGRPVLFIHSVHAAASSAEWRFTVPATAEHYTTYAIDLLGFGASARPPVDYTAEMYLALLRDFVREVIGKPTILIGSSLGGTYALAIAAQAPTFARAVVAVGPAGVVRLAEPGGRMSRLAQGLLRSRQPGALLFRLLTTRTSIKLFLRGIYSRREILDEERVTLFHEAARQPGAQFAPAAFIGMRLNLDLRPVLPLLARPFLLLWGEHATQSPPSEALPVRALAPVTQFAMLPGGDLPHDERPDVFNSTLLHFLNGLG